MTAAEPITTIPRYDVTVDDFMSGVHAHWSAHWQGRGMFLVVGGIGLAISPLVFEWWGSGYLSQILLGASIGLVLVVFLRDFLWRRAFRELEDRSHSLKVEVFGDRLDWTTPNGFATHQWDYYHGYRVCKTVVLLYITRQQFQVVPLSAFDDGAHRERFIEALDLHLTRCT